MAISESVTFSCPSAGTAVVNVGNLNGRINWNAADTVQTYQQCYDEKRQAAGLDTGRAE
ncbi:MAG: hypothetical protein HQ518_25915 [Rhodopirellula sp.]|nr:hypothetical protein [Rhodopirellula sp.]